VNPDAVGARFEGATITWSSDDALLYALGVGAGSADPSAELAFTTDNSHGIEQSVLPTFAAVLGGKSAFDGGDPLRLAGDFGLEQLLHGGQRIVLHGALPVSGAAQPSVTISGLYDKGKNALLETTTELHDRDTGALLAESIMTVVILGEGGFGGDPGETPSWTTPARAPDARVSYTTRPEQALLYRLNGDRNPLHSDPWFARNLGGLDRPILHGLCTYGFAGRMLLAEGCGSDPERFGSMDARFASMVVPGDVLDIRMWRRGDGALFQALVGDRVVLDRGTFTVR
jgi:acyl dehydratase